MSIPYILTDTTASIFIDFTPYTVPSTHSNWDTILDALSNPDTTEDDLLKLLDVGKAVSNYLSGAVEYRDRAIYYNGTPVNTGLTRRIIQHMEADRPGLAAPLIRFLENVLENPSRRAVQGLYEWAERSNLPITPDGCVLAYKIVNDDFTDCYSGKFDNSPGTRVEVPRNHVDEDPDQTCSYGLHICSKDYLPHFGPSNKKVVIVKVHPKDFVAVPRDYNTAKARVCGYNVLKEVPKETAATYFPDAYVYDPDPTSIAPGQVWRDSDGDHHRILEVHNDGTVLTHCYEHGGRDSYMIENLDERVDDLFAVGEFYLDSDGDSHEVLSICDNEVVTSHGGMEFRFNRSGSGIGEDYGLTLLPN